jgi:hypothetical protein
MSQTILQAGQAVARAVGIDPPNSFVANTEDTAARMLQAMRDAGRALARRDWVCLVYEHVFTTAAGITDYQLPTSPAWHHMVPGTAWDRTNFSATKGNITPAAWQAEKGFGLAATFFARPWRLKADAGRERKFSLVDDPGGAYTIAYEYVTDQWCFDGASIYYADIQADSNQPVFDDYLFEMQTRWRVLKALGLPYQEEQREAVLLENTLFGQERARDVLLMPETLAFSNNAPEYGYG